MNCAKHTDAPAVAYCRTCGKPLCSACTRDVRGVIYCEECLQASGVVPSPGAQTVPAGARPPADVPNPRLAAFLGFIPGVGAMYNGEFAKGFIHVLIFATLIWMSDHISGIFGLGIAAFVIYMPIEAYKTARARELGLPAPDPLGLNSLFKGTNVGRDMFQPDSAPAPAAGAVPADTTPATPAPQAPEAERSCSRVPVGAFILIGLGVLFLLDEMNLLHFEWILQRFWPLILIAIGVRILVQRQRRGW